MGDVSDRFFHPCRTSHLFHTSRQVLHNPKGMYFSFNLWLCITYFQLSATAFSKLKFQEWFPDFEADMKPSWTTGDCQRAHYEYFYNRTSRQDRCGALLECILENTNEKRKTTMASASVVLGVTPPLLAGLGQSLAEISLLSSQRPVLAFLIALGAPALYPTRVFEYTHPSDALKSLPGNLGITKLRSSYWGLVTLAEYIVTAVAVGSNIELAVDIGTRSVLAWGCNSWAMPLFWVLYPISLHAICFAGYYVTIPRQPTKSKVNHPKTWIVSSILSKSTALSISRAPTIIYQLSIFLFRSSWSNHFWTLAKMEILPTVNRARGPLPDVPRTTTAILLQILASALAFVHILLGTMILSSLIFIGFHDTVRILLRFIASALVCRAILMFELAGIQEVTRVEN